jgi:hypothetical protein
MEYRLEVLTLPVTDVDRAAAFYAESAGFQEVGYHAANPIDGAKPQTRTA